MINYLKSLFKPKTVTGEDTPVPTPSTKADIQRAHNAYLAESARRQAAMWDSPVNTDGVLNHSAPNVELRRTNSSST